MWAPKNERANEREGEFIKMEYVNSQQTMEWLGRRMICSDCKVFVCVVESSDRWVNDNISRLRDRHVKPISIKMATISIEMPKSVTSSMELVERE